MRYSFLSFFTFSSLLLATIAAAAPVACTMEYAPVCGKVQVQCIKAPCYPIYQTFGNKCTLDGTANATFVKAGECGTQLEGAPVTMPEYIRISLTAKYTNFIGELSDLSSADELKVLQAFVARVEARKSQIESMNSITLERRDLLFAALDLLKNLAENNITEIQNLMAGAKYMSHDVSKCTMMDYLCTTGMQPFSDTTGCGCKKFS